MSKYFNDEAIAKLLAQYSPQEIADDFAGVLNAAILKRDKKKAEEELQKKKQKDAYDLESLIIDYVKKYYPEIGDQLEEFSEKDAEIFVGAIDQLCQEFKRIKPEVLDPITMFLKKNNL